MKNSTDWHVLTIQQALEAQQITFAGLTPSQAAQRLQRDGANQLKEKPPKSIWWLFLAQFQSVLIVVLIAAAGLATFIGDEIDGMVIMTVVFINSLLGFYQEFQAEKSLASLKKMLSLQATVRRDNDVIEIAAKDLVQGDIVLLEAGNKIPADGRLLKAIGVECDESALTGESIPVEKQTEALQSNTPLAERSNMLFMNNVVTRGRGEMLVTATGMDTEIGKLAQLLTDTEEQPTPLQNQLDRLGKRLAGLALVIVLILFARALWRGEPLIETAFTAIALAVAAIPEGLPAVVTVTLALGMHRMAKQKAIVKRLSAVETLGCTTVICTDKTGTLTVNQMTVREFFYHGKNYHVSGEGYDSKGEITPSCVTKHDLLLPLMLCNDSHNRSQEIIGDPMEGALLVLAEKGGMNYEHARMEYPRLAEIPFDAEHKFMATFHRHGGDVLIFVKGAPEVILDRCQLSVDDRVDLRAKNASMARTGLRVLAVAMHRIPASGAQPRFSGITKEYLWRYIEKLQFVSLIGLQDPPRVEVCEAIRLCHQAGIAVKMITGDQATTATAIARELGLHGETLEGEALSELDDEELAEKINDISVFARIAPEQKMRLVNALKKQGHVVAMTGDGVNDAPALKSADIGIAMGKSGTDVAQEAATMILTDDNFASIVNAVREGRGIYDNMVKFIRFQLSTNIGAILCVAIAPLLYLPLPFSAIQLLWINIIMDGPPAMSLGVDPVRSNTMNEPPRGTHAQLLSLRRLAQLFFYGIIMASGTLGILFYDLQQFDDIEHAKTLAFTTFVLFQIFNVFNARSEKGTALNRQFFKNRWLWLSLISVVGLQFTMVYWEIAQTIFHTADLDVDDAILSVSVASSVLILEEVRKLLTPSKWR
ncbi:MAG: calcium-translocating P-type ATPase, PMCA-type [Methylococcales bacterium]|nr:calcium-translocating P-type ATPase, PMCA-type [Methylococcales bacterium]